MPQPETRYAKGAEGHVAYQIVGDGPFDLVFVPGWTSNVDVMWEEPALARLLRATLGANRGTRTRKGIPGEWRLFAADSPRTH
jgi:hypothetical protein